MTFTILAFSFSAAAQGASTGQTTDNKQTAASCTMHFADITPVVDPAPMRHKAFLLAYRIFGSSDDETVTLNGMRYSSEAAARKQFQKRIRKNKKDLVEPPSIVTINGITETRVIMRSTRPDGEAGFSIISLSEKSIWEIMSPSLQDAECFEKSYQNPYRR
jgi:hypothetical protein